MSLDRTVRTAPRRAYGRTGGFSIVSAIFLLVTMTVLGVALLRFTTVQQLGFAQDVQGAKAYRAARAGVEWGLYRLLRQGSCEANAANLPQLGGSGAALGGALAGFSVVVHCTASGPYQESGIATNIYTIVSTASSGAAGTTAYVERQVSVTLEAP